MILKIVLCIFVVQIVVNFLQYVSLKKAILDVRKEIPVDSHQQQMSQIENDLNMRLREIQTSQFSPRMSTRPMIRLVKQEGDD